MSMTNTYEIQAREKIAPLPPIPGVLQHLTDLIDTYNLRCGTAYNRMFAELRKLIDNVDVGLDFELKSSGGVKMLSSDTISDRDKEDIKKSYLAIAGRCGSAIGSARKFCQRQIVVGVLKDAVDHNGVDITPAVANATMKAVVGHGSDKVALNKYFGTPGRTAAQKSLCYTHSVHAENLKVAQEEAHTVVLYFISYTHGVRLANAIQWREVWFNRK